MTARKQFDIFDGLLYLGIKMLFGKNTPPIENVLIGRPVQRRPDTWLFDGDECATQIYAWRAREQIFVVPTAGAPRLVTRHG